MQVFQRDFQQSMSKKKTEDSPSVVKLESDLKAIEEQLGRV